LAEASWSELGSIVTKEYKTSIYAVIVILFVLGVVFSFPPIISREGRLTPKPKTQSIASDEQSFCRENLDDVNCSCFARKAAHILAQDQPKLHGFTYADRSLLARGQASTTC
jgi:hypothetical protein